MAFPETRLSLIRRIVATGDADSWDQFVAGYWRATCRFAMQIGKLQWSDAEDAASQVFEVLVKKSLLESWLARPEARFKTLLCTVIKYVVQNSVRAQQTAARHVEAQIQHAIDEGTGVARQDEDLFYSIWVEELLQTAVQTLMKDYHREGKGDYYRVLYGRICEELPFKTIAEQLELSTTNVENYYRHARQRLGAGLERLLRIDISYYTEFADIDAEFRREWDHLAAWLQREGGLENAIRRGMTAHDSP